MLFKIKWMLSAIFLSFFLKKIKFPTYFAFPIFFTGLNKVSIGKKVRIFPHSRFEVHGDGEIHIGDNVGIGQSFHITSASKLTIGSGTLILARVFVTNIDHKYNEINVPILEQGNIVSETHIGKNCFIGIGAAIQAGTILGDNVIVGANSVVRGKFPSYSVIAGVPARVIKKYDHELGIWRRTDTHGVFIEKNNIQE